MGRRYSGNLRREELGSLVTHRGGPYALGQAAEFIYCVSRTKMRVWGAMERDPIFCHRPSMGLDEYRSVTAQRLHRFLELDLVPDSEVMETPLKSAALVMSWVSCHAFDSAI